jgi:hypothetical protein
VTVAVTLLLGRLTGPAGPLSVNVVVLIEAAFIGLLKVTVTLVLGATLTARFAGVVETTTGTASLVPVLNVQT